MTSPTASPVIRKARSEDAAELAALSRELGYDTSLDAMNARLQSLGGRADDAVLACVAEAGIEGWLHAQRRLLLESGWSAEIVGLVVSASARRSGVGRRLVAAAIDWARLHQLDRVVVRSSTARIESHAFYRAIGFAATKQQQVYRLGLDAAE